MDRPHQIRLLREILIPVVSGLIIAFVTHWIDRDKGTTRISIVSPAPAPADAKRELLVRLHQLAAQMSDEADDGELSALSRDAITFRNEFDGNDGWNAVGFGTKDNLELIVGEATDEMSAYINGCGSDLNAKSKNWAHCGDIATNYLAPSLHSLSRALERRIDAMAK